MQIRAEIAAPHKRLGTTTLYVTHHQVEAMMLGSRVAVLCGGRLQQVARADLRVYPSLWAGVGPETLSLGQARGSLRVRVEAIESLGHEHSSTGGWWVFRSRPRHEP